MSIPRFLSLCAFAAFLWWHASGADAAKLPDFKVIGATSTGKSVSMGPTGQAAAFDTRIPMAPVNNGASGWTTAGNYGVSLPPTGPTMNLGASGDVFFSGVKYPFQAGYVVPTSALLTAASLLCATPLTCLAVTVGSPYLLDWIASASGRVTPSGEIERSDPNVCSVAPCYEYFDGNAGGAAAWHSTKAAACISRAAGATSTDSNRNYTFKSIGAAGECVLGQAWKPDSMYCCGAQPDTSYSPATRGAAPLPSAWLPSSMDDIAPYMSPRPDPRVFRELLEKGADIPLPNPTLTGPSTLPGTEKTTANPDGSRTVEKTTYNFNTEGNKITNTSNTTNVTTYNADNSVRSVSIVNEVKSDDEHPEPVADTPLGELPKLYTPKYPQGLEGVWTTQKAALVATPLASLATHLMPSVGDGGTCPVWNLNLDFGVPWANFGTKNVAPVCDVWGWARLIILVGALLLARALVFGG